MIDFFISLIQTHLLPYGGVGVFAASVIEEVIAPIPSAFVGLAAGFLFVSGPLSLNALFQLFLTVVIPIAAGVTLGSLFVYFIAYYAGKPFLLRWGKWLGVNWSDVEKIQQKFSGTKFDEWSLVIVRSIPIVPSVVVSAFCGLIRFPIREYIAYTFLGTLVRATILGFVGWRVGEIYFKYATFIGIFEKIILGLGITAVIAFIVWRRYRVKAPPTFPSSTSPIQ